MRSQRGNYPLWLGLCLLHLSAPVDIGGAEVHDSSFVLETIHGGAGMVPLTFGPGSRLYVGEKRGRILVFERDPADPSSFLPPQVFASLESSVDYQNERGLLGLDILYTSPPQMYAFYSYSTGQRVVRFEMDETYTGVAGPPQTILDGLPNTRTNHNGGDIRFGLEGLYITLGDDANASSAQNLDVYNGKILLVDENGLGLPGNPFFDGDVNSIRSRIWGYGCRNPFRFTSFDGALYVSENGNSTDRVSRWSAAGANGGWPDEFFDPSDPDVVNLFTEIPSITGIGIVSGGPFADPAFPESDALYLANWQADWIRRWRLTGADLDQAVPIDSGGTNDFVTGLPDIAHLTFGYDGLYLTTTGTSGLSGTLYRIRYVSGAPPVAAFSTSPDPAEGSAPLTVDFTDLSTDDGTMATWQWDFGDGTSSSEQNPSHTFAVPSVYTVALTVTDDIGLTDTASAEVTVNQGTLVELSGTIWDGRSLPPVGLPVSTELRLYQLDGVTPLPFPGGSGSVGNSYVVPVGGSFSLMAQVDLTDCGIVISAGEPDADGFQPAFRGLPIVCDSPTFSATLEFYLSDTAIAGRVLDTLGTPAAVDLGVSRSAPGSLFPVAGGRDFLPPIPPSGVPHRIESDELGYYFIPIPTGQANADFFMDVVADTGQSSYLSTVFQETVPAGSRVEHDVTIGLQAGGAACDAASGPGGPVSFTQIQAIFNANCVGCHSGLDPNAGLDLSEGVSYAAIVDVPSAEVPGLKLVEPGDSTLSFLWEKTNCSLPQVGSRMPTGFSLALGDQGKIHDWIDQGALPTIVPPQISCPGDLLISCAPAGGTAVSYDVTVLSDDDAVVLECDQPSGSIFPGGTTTVNCTATDSLNQVASCSFEITVELKEGDRAFIRGNVNSRGLHRLDIGDVVDLVNFLFGGLVLGFDCAAALDVNDDGVHNVVDVVALAQGLFGPTNYTIPAPTSAPAVAGVDGGSVPSTLGCAEGETCE